MKSTGGFIKGFLTVLTVTAAPQLYRYPYRNNSEALRGDMMRVGADMGATLERMQPAKTFDDSDGEE